MIRLRRVPPWFAFFGQVSLVLLTFAITGCAPTTASKPTATVFAVTVTTRPANAIALNPTRVPAADHPLGPDNAFLTITMYGDFQCDLCLEVARNLAIIRDEYPADVRVIFRHYPQVSNNDKALLAAQAAEAASAQGKFWDMHDQLFAHQAEWKGLSLDEFRKKLNEYAATVRLDPAAFSAALDNQTGLPIIQQAIAEAEALDLKGVPVLLFNGQPYSGRIDLFALEGFARLKLLEKRWYATQPELQIDLKKKYTATLHTERGDVVIELFADAAPVTVNNFVALARDGWFNNNTFHLVLPGQYVQTGDPSGSGFGGPGYHIIDEHDNGLTFDREGIVAMASDRGTANSGGSQFFISLAPLRPAADFDRQFTIFGHVISGMDVLQQLTPRNPFDEVHFPNPAPGDKLISVSIKEE